jgi:hypothetical protein
MLQELTQAIKDGIQNQLNNVHTIAPGNIVSFYPDTCEADISVYGVYRKPKGGTVPFPRLCRVPVMFPQGAGQAAAIVYPVKSGDSCLVLFSEQALDFWRTGNTTSTDLRFDLTNALAIVGLFSKPNPLVAEAVTRNAVIISQGGSKISLLENGTVEIEGNVTVNGSITATGTVRGSNI